MIRRTRSETEFWLKLYLAELKKWKDNQRDHPEVPEPRPQDFHLKTQSDLFVARIQRDKILTSP